MSRKIIAFVLSHFWSSFLCATHFAVIMDDEHSVYRKVLTGLSLESRMPMENYRFNGSIKKEELVARVIAAQPTVIIAIGPRSANAFKKAVRSIPIVFCMVPRLEDYDLTQSNVAGIRLEHPLEQQLQVLRELFPNKKRVGVVYHPKLSAGLLARAKSLAHGHHIQLVDIKVSRPEHVAATIKKFAKQVDLMWMLGDRTALHLNAFEAVLSFSVANRLHYFLLN